MSCFKRSTSRSNWNLEVLVFVEGGKPENSEKNPRSKVRTNNSLGDGRRALIYCATCKITEENDHLL